MIIEEWKNTGKSDMAKQFEETGKIESFYQIVPYTDKDWKKFNAEQKDKIKRK